MSWSYNGQSYTCADFNTVCATYFGPDNTGECYSELLHKWTTPGVYETSCDLRCNSYDFTHYTFIFTAFVMCQVFNEFNARELFNGLNVFRGLHKNPVFIFIFFLTVAMQIIIVEWGGKFVKTTPMPIELWAWSTLMGLLSLPVALFLKIVFPIQEAESTFFGYTLPDEKEPVPAHLAALVSGAGAGAGAHHAKVDDHTHSHA